jgi:hypothetical protein
LTTGTLFFESVSSHLGLLGAELVHLVFVELVR